MEKYNRKRPDAQTIFVIGVMAVMGGVGSVTLVCGLLGVSISEIGVLNGMGMILGISGCLFGGLLLGNLYRRK